MSDTGSIPCEEALANQTKHIRELLATINGQRLEIAALREARQQEREMVEVEIVAWLLTIRNRWDSEAGAYAEALAGAIERGDWKHSAGTGEG